MNTEFEQKDLLLSKLTLDLIFEMIFWIDLSGKFFLVNEAACKNLGYSKEELIKLTVPDVDLKNNIQYFKKKWKEIEKIGRISFEIFFRTKTDDTFPADITANFVEFEGQKYLCAVARNISVRKEVEDKLIASEERYRTLFESANDAIFIMDREKFVDCNSKTLEIFGYSEKKEIVGHTPWEFSPHKQPDGALTVKKAKDFVKEAMGGETVRFYWRHTRSNGEEFDADITLNRIVIRDKIYLQAICRDKTEELSALNALKESEEKFQRSFSNNPTSLHITTIPDGKFVEVNSLFEILSGYTKEELIGKTSVEMGFYVTAEDRDGLFKELQEKGRLVDYEIKFKIKSGEHLICRVFSEIVDIKGEPHLVSHVKDITSIKLAEIELYKEKERLGESEEKFRTMAETSPDAVTITDMDARITFVSRRTAEIHGYNDPSEMIGMRAFDIVSPEDRESAIRKFWKGFFTESLRDVEFKLLRADKSIFNGELSGSVLRNKEGIPIGSMIISRDITQRKLAEKALIESEERYRLLIENIPTVAWKTNKNGQTTFISSNVETIYGFTPGEIYKGGVSLFTDRVHKEDRGRIKKSFADLFEKGSEYNVEYRLQRKDGTWIWINDRAGIVREEEGMLFAYGVFSDITDQKSAELDLKGSRLFADNLIQTANVMIIGLDNSGKIQIFNPSAERITGYSQKDLLGDSWFKKLVPRDRYPEVWSEFNRLQEGGMPRTFENPILTKNGQERFISWSNNQLVINRENIGTISFGIDITERRRAQLEIEAYQENLQSMTAELNLVEEKERRRIAINLHDHLSQSLAMAKIKLTSLKKESLSGKIIEIVQEANNLITEAIENSRSITYELSPPVLYELGLVPAIQWYLEKIEKEYSINTKFSVEGEFPKLDEDHQILIFRSVSELLNNVIKHAKASQTEVSLQKENESIIITVSDNGKGFEPKKHTKGMKGKGGFGLFSIRERLGYFNGKLEIVSAKGSGVSATITIPILK